MTLSSSRTFPASRGRGGSRSRRVERAFSGVRAARCAASRGMSSRRRAAGEVDAHDADAVIEVLAEAAGRDLVVEVARARGDDPHVDRAALGRAEGADRLLLEHAQERDLELDGHVGDLVEEQRAAMRLDEEPVARAIGAGEGAADVPESSDPSRSRSTRRN